MKKPERRKGPSSKRDYYTIITGLALIGMLMFRIPLFHVIGDKGLACYGTAYEIYYVLGGMISYGLLEAVSVLVRYRVRREQYKNAQKVLGSALLLGGGIGAVFSLLFGIFGHMIAKNVFHMPLAGLSVCMMAPAMFFFILTGVFRGYFQGNGSRVPAMHSMLLQTVVLLAGGLIFGNIFAEYGRKVSALLQNEDYTSAYGAMGASVGLLISAVLCFLHVLILYLLFKENIKRQMSREMPKNQDSRFHLFHMLLGTGSMYFLYWFFFYGQALAGELILMRFTENPGEMLVGWGSYYGRILPVLGIVCYILHFVFLSAVRKIVALQEREEHRLAREKAGILFHQSIACSVFLAVLLAVFSENLLDALFGGNNEQTALWMQLGSVMVVLFTYSALFMESLIKSRRLAYVTGIGAGAFLLQAVVLVLMIKSQRGGIFALVIAGIIFYATTAAGGFVLVGRKMQYTQEWIRGTIMTILAAALSGILAMLFNRAFTPLIGGLLSFIICMVIATAVYLVLLVVTRAFGPEELEKMPGGWILLRLAGLFHMM